MCIRDRALSEAAGRVGRSDAYKPPATSREIRVSRPPYFIASRSFTSVRVRPCLLYTSVLGQGIDIHDAAADGELAWSLHLDLPFVAQTAQLLRQGVDLDNAVLADTQNGVFHFFQGAQAIHQAVEGGNHRDFFPGKQGLQGDVYKRQYLSRFRHP